MDPLRQTGKRVLGRLPSPTAFKRRAPANRSGRARAGRHDADFVFVVTYGKSGSTLLMGLLNSLPGYHIRGENGGVLYDLYQYHSKVLRWQKKWASAAPMGMTHPWYGIDGYPARLARDHLRELVIETLLRPEPGTTVTGFKEIRWWMKDCVEYMDFIESVFPGARFILNTRNLEDVARSSWYRKDPDSLKKLQPVDAQLREAIATRGDRGYHVHYDDYVRDHEQLRGLCEWLGAPYDPESIEAVFATPHTTKASRA